VLGVRQQGCDVLQALPDLPLPVLNFMERLRAICYTRASGTRGQNAPYKQKFAGLIKACDDCKAQGVRLLVVAWPWVLGDTHKELIESLSRIADAGLVLHITERQDPNQI
jgi:hypothetical protein